MRLDLYLYENNYYSSREKSKEAILKKAVLVNSKLIDKPSYDVTNPKIEILFSTNNYVSRGGIKLAQALDSFKIDFNDKVIVDVGASTGGFTDCAIQNGAKKVYAIENGSNQLDKSLKNNLKIISYENTNILDVKQFDEEIDYYIIDVSFISIKRIIPHLIKLKANKLIILIKPQYEANNILLNKKGILKKPKDHLKIILELEAFLLEEGLYIKQMTYSPIKGKEGNIEYLVYVEEGCKKNINFLKIISEAFLKVSDL